MIGTTLGHYRVLEKLGEGGMGVVYKAQDLHLDRFVALKILPSEQLADPERKRRFTQEAKAASALNHPHIITIYDISSDGGVDFIAMEYVAGKTLDQLIPPQGMRVDEALRIAVQVADALAAAHAIGIVHRDVKPSNVMVSDQGRVKVLDFGTVKLTAQGEAAASDAITMGGVQTGEGRIVGTVCYMSPEQAQGLPVDERSDIFSFGSLLYEMVSGQRPFRGDSSVMTLAAIIEKDPPPLSGRLPEELERVLDRCLQKDVSRRYQHIADVRVALQELVDERVSQPRRAGAKAKATRSLPWTAAAAVSVLILAAAGWFLFFRGEPALPPARLVSLTSYPGVEDWPVLSPDGTRVAFQWNGEKEDNTDIYVQYVGETRALRLTTDALTDGWPTWSPDGRQLAFERRGADGRSGTLFLVSALGGPEQRLVELPGLMPGVSWSADGKWLAVTVAVLGRTIAPQFREGAGSSSLAPGVYLVPVAGGEPRQITFPASPGTDVFAVFSQSGTSLAFARYDRSLLLPDIYVQSLTPDGAAAGSPRRITRDGLRRTPGLAWTRDDEAIIYSGQPGMGLDYLYRVPVQGDQPPERIELAGLGAVRPAVARDRLTFSRIMTDYDIWRFRADGGSGPLIRSSFAEWSPEFSPDGQRVAFTSNRSGETSEIWLASTDGTNPIQLTHGSGQDRGSPRWSPDGQRLAFDSRDSQGSVDVFTIDSAGGQPQRFVSDRSIEGQPTWARDGRSIYFQSNRTGRFEIWRCPFPAGPPEGCQQMTTNGGDVAVESVDGKTLFYTNLTGELYAKPLGGGREQKLIDVVTRGFAVLQDGIFYCGSPGKDGTAPLQFYTFSSRSSREIARINPSNSGLTISPDRKTVLYSASLSFGQDLMLIENFRPRN